MDTSEIFSRETLAGYDRKRLSQAVIVVVGAGAAGSNFVQTTALAGVGEHRVIDFDVVERSNLTRSPFFRRPGTGDASPRFKARELARGVLATSYAESPVVRYATTRVETLGYGAFQGADVIVAAVDSHPVRAYLADAARFLGIPLIEMGFSGFEGQVSVFRNATSDEPCWRCLMPHVSHGGFSCTAYARRVAESGRVPATQTVAAVVGSLAAEAAIAAVHREFPLGGRILSFNVRSGRSRVLAITPNPSCPGVHRLVGSVMELAARHDEPLASALSQARAFASEPVALLPSPIVVEAPCERCGTRVIVQRPACSLRDPPSCPSCEASQPSAAPASAIVVGSLGADHPLARMKAAKLGLPACAVFEIEDAATRELHAVRLAGSVDDLFVTKRRVARHDKTQPPMFLEEAGDPGQKGSTT